MPSLLGYWDLRGLGQAIRLMLSYAGEEFEEKRYTFGGAPDYSREDWLSEKFTLGFDFPNLPYYVDGDVKITQSNAILRHLARKYDMVGSTEAERVANDMLIDQVMDFYVAFAMMCVYNENYEEKRVEYLKTLPSKLKLFEDFLGDKPFSAGQKITFPDFYLYEAIDVHKMFDPSCLDDCPKLQAFLQRFEDLPAIKKYMASDSFIKTPVFAQMAKWGYE